MTIRPTHIDDEDDTGDQDEEIFVSTETLANMTGISERHIRRLADAGRLPHRRVGERRLYRFDLHWAMRFAGEEQKRRFEKAMAWYDAMDRHLGIDTRLVKSELEPFSWRLLMARLVEAHISDPSGQIGMSATPAMTANGAPSEVA